MDIIGISVAVSARIHNNLSLERYSLFYAALGSMIILFGLLIMGV